MLSNALPACLAPERPVANRDRLARLALLFTALAFLQLHALADQKLIKISTLKDESRTEFVVENLQYADVTITLEMEMKNLSATASLPYTETLAPRSKTTVFSVTPIDPNEDSGWSYTYYATWGSLTAVHDDSYIYSLPFPSGRVFPVSQGFHGKYSHTGGDAYSIDFKMPEGSPVNAAREGVVVGIKDDSDIGGPDKKYEWDANYILIRHSDGTLGHYVHLQKAGCRVKIGQKVKVGQWIGLSGNTGHSTGAHLHFAVFKAQSGKQRQTIPIKYRTTRLLAEVLSEGQSYRAF